MTSVPRHVSYPNACPFGELEVSVSGQTLWAALQTVQHPVIDCQLLAVGLQLQALTLQLVRGMNSEYPRQEFDSRPTPPSYTQSRS